MIKTGQSIVGHPTGKKWERNKLFCLYFGKKVIIHKIKLNTKLPHMYEVNLQEEGTSPK